MGMLLDEDRRVRCRFGPTVGRRAKIAAITIFALLSTFAFAEGQRGNNSAPSRSQNSDDAQTSADACDPNPWVAWIDDAPDDDEDGIPNAYEVALETDRQLPDTDDDGIADVVEHSLRAAGFASSPTDSLSRHGVENLVLSLDGTMYLEVPLANEPVDGSGAGQRLGYDSWTVEAWIRPRGDATTEMVVIQRVLNTIGGQIAVVNYELGLDPAHRPYALWSKGNTIRQVIGGQAIASGPDNFVWTHLAATFDANAHVFFLYVNGVEVARNFSAFGQPQVKNPDQNARVLIGAAVDENDVANGFSRSFVGDLDEVRIWGDARTPQELRDGFERDFDVIHGVGDYHTGLVPSAGVYDAGIDSQIGEWNGFWRTPTGQAGLPLNNAMYDDANTNGVRDGDEVLWLDNGNGIYDPDTSLDRSLMGTPAAGATGVPIALYFNDIDRDGHCDANEDVWQDYVNTQSPHVPSFNDWAAMIDLGLYIKFDDGPLVTVVASHDNLSNGALSSDINGTVLVADENQYYVNIDPLADGQQWVVNPVTPTIQDFAWHNDWLPYRGSFWATLEPEDRWAHGLTVTSGAPGLGLTTANDAPDITMMLSDRNADNIPDGVSVLPAAPTTDSTLLVTAEGAFDTNGDVFGYEYQWYYAPAGTGTTRNDSVSGLLGAPWIVLAGMTDSRLSLAGVYDDDTEAGTPADTIVFDTGNFDTAPGTVGAQQGLYYRDGNGNQMWDADEDIWRDHVSGESGIYDDGIDTRIYDGIGDLVGSWTTVTGAVGAQRGLYYNDRNHNRAWDVNEDIWKDDYTVALDYTCVVLAVDEHGARSQGVQGNVVTTSPAGGTPTSPQATIVEGNSSYTATITQESTDPDGDAVTYISRWAKNHGEAVTPWSHQLEPLSSNNTAINIGDVIFLELFATDEIDTNGNATGRRSAIVTSNTITHGGGVGSNDAPSTPEIALMPDQPRTEQDDIRCVVSTPAVDPDGDSVAYGFTWFGFAEGLGTYVALVRALDGEGNPVVRLPAVATGGSADGEEPFTGGTSLPTTNVATQILAHENRELEDLFIYCEIFAVDSHGNRSATVRSQIVRVLPGDTGTGGDGEDSFEPDDTSDQAQSIALNLADEIHDGSSALIGQDHTLSFEDNDWLKFTLLETSDVDILTGRDLEGIEERLLQLGEPTSDLGVDTKMWLFSESDLHSEIAFNDDNGALSDGTFTLSARIQHRLSPGTYFVQIAPHHAFTQIPEDYAVAIVSEPVFEAPNAPNTPTLQPSEPLTTEDLVADISGVADHSTLRYRWYVDGVPVNVTQENVLSAEFTQPGQTWQVAAYIDDGNSTSEDSGLSNAVVISQDEYLMTFRVSKTFDGTEAPVQTVTVGWRSGATHGWDENIDADLAVADGVQVFTPGIEGAPTGSFFSRGFSTDHQALVTDIRPFGAATTWYLYVDLGDQPTHAALEWDQISLPRTDLPITFNEVDPQNDFALIPGTSVDLLTHSELEIDPSAGGTAGQNMKVFRLTLGVSSRSVSLTLAPGWNLISLPITPNEPSPDIVFSNNTGKVISGVVWGYENGSYFQATEIEAARGYWVYNPSDVDATVVVGGHQAPVSKVFHEGWNLVGAIGASPIPTGINPFEVLYFANGTYLLIDTTDENPLKETVGYWMKSDRERVVVFGE